MHIITVGSRKGGIGKTTTAGGLAQGLAAQGRKVALIDLDSQINAASMFVLRVSQDFRLEHWFNGDTPVWDVSNGVHILYGIGASEGLAEEALRERVESLAAEKFDYVIFDCPPSAILAVRSALAVADTILAVADGGDWAVAGALAVKDSRKPNQRFAFVVARFNARKSLDGMAVTVLSRYQIDVFTVSNESKVPNATASHAGFPKNGKASLDMWELTKFIMEVEA